MKEENMLSSFTSRERGSLILVCFFSEKYLLVFICLRCIVSFGLGYLLCRKVLSIDILLASS